MNSVEIETLSKAFEKKASELESKQFFTKYERLSDSIQALTDGLAMWYNEGVGEFYGSEEDKAKYSELCDKAYELFSSALESIKPQLESIENEMDEVFERSI